MSQWRAIPMLLSGGLFVGLVAIAWERVPAWWASDPVDFRTEFAPRLGRVDRLQPALLAVCLGSAIGLPAAPVAPRALAALAAGGFLVVLVGSVVVLVPIQRRLVASESPPRSAVEALQARWCGGHLVRTVVALACFALAAWFVDPNRNWIGLLQFQEPVR
jgi:hypothetical protein